MRKMKDSEIEWIGAIPAAWGVHRIASHFQEVKEKNTANEYSNALQFKMGRIIAKPQKWDEEELNEIYAAYTVVHPNTIMINGLNLEFDFVTQRVAQVECDGIITSAYIALSPRDDINAKYICYLLKSYDACRAFHSMGRGLRKILSFSELKNKPIIVPPLTEQGRIAAFLDAECAEIDAVLEKTRASIDEYKQLKHSVITQAVTKGIRGDKPMKDSGIEWIGEIPKSWGINTIFQLCTQVKNKNVGLIENNLLSLSYGKIKRKNIDAVEGLLPESFDGYNIIEKDDIVLRLTDLQNDHTSLRVGISEERGIITSAYLTIRNRSNFVPKYLYYYLHSFDISKGFYGMGAGVRQSLNWDGLKWLKVITPSREEQEQIAEFLNTKCTEIDNLISKKEQYITEIENYKKSLIYEYVTGKKECPAMVQNEDVSNAYPYFPAPVHASSARFAQAVLMSKILEESSKGMGRVKLEKTLFTIENHIGFNFDTEYLREAAGPLDASIYECEKIITRRNKWFSMKTSSYGVSYAPTNDVDKYKKYYAKYFSEYNSEIERIIDVFRNYTTEQAEIIATLFAAWNDAIIDKKQFTDDDIVDDVLNNWHESKRRFPRQVWLRAMNEIRKNHIIPKGYGKHTVMKEMQ